MLGPASRRVGERVRLADDRTAPALTITMIHTLPDGRRVARGPGWSEFLDRLITETSVGSVDDRFKGLERLMRQSLMDALSRNSSVPAEDRVRYAETATLLGRLEQVRGYDSAAARRLDTRSRWMARGIRVVVGDN